MKFSQKIIKTTIASFNILSVPLSILNIFGAIVSGVWLGILGEWNTIVGGIVTMLISTFILSFALIPPFLLGALSIPFLKRNKITPAICLAFLSSIYVNGLITIWCLWIFNYYSNLASGSALIPTLIWSYEVATMPWARFTQGEQGPDGNEWAIVTLFFTEIAYIIAIIMFFFGLSFVSITVTFASIMIVSGILQSFITLIIPKQVNRILEKIDE